MIVNTVKKCAILKGHFHNILIFHINLDIWHLHSRSAVFWKGYDPHAGSEFQDTSSRMNVSSEARADTSSDEILATSVGQSCPLGT